MANDAVHGEPPSVVFIRAAVTWIRGHRRAAVVWAVVVALLTSLATALYTVANGESAAVQRFGRLLDDRSGPGLHLRLPWGIDTVSRVKTGTIFRLELGGDVFKQLSLVTGDENLIDAALVLQYKITDLGRFLFATENPEALLGEAVRSALVETVARTAVDDVLTAGKATVQTEVRAHAQSMLDAHGIGITVVAVNLQSATPPSEAAQAFREVNDAKAEAAGAVNDAQSKRERALSLARGEAGKIVEEARAKAAARVAQARGAAERFQRLLEREKSLPAQTRTDLYLDTVKKVLPRAKIVVLAPGQKPKIDLNLIQRPASAKTKTPASPASMPKFQPQFPEG